MTQRDWGAGDGHVVGLFLNGHEFPYRGRRGEQIIDDSFLLLINAHSRGRDVHAAGAALGVRQWALELSHRRPGGRGGLGTYARARRGSRRSARSVTVLKRTDPAT